MILMSICEHVCEVYTCVFLLFLLFSLVILGQVFYCGSGDMCAFPFSFFLCIVCAHTVEYTYIYIHTLYMCISLTVTNTEGVKQLVLVICKFA